MRRSQKRRFRWIVPLALVLPCAGMVLPALADSGSQSGSPIPYRTEAGVEAMPGSRGSGTVLLEAALQAAGTFL